MGRILILCFCFLISAGTDISFTFQPESQVQKNNYKEWPSELLDSFYGKITIDYSAVSDSQCGIRTAVGWGFDKFLPAEDKSVGIWPYNFSSSHLKELNEKWGYSKLFFIYEGDSIKWNEALSAGYSSDKIMVALHAVPEDKRFDLIKRYGDVYAYYVDEPADQNRSTGGILDAINKLNFNSLFVISGYKRTGSLTEEVEKADYVMFSSYKHWWQCLPGIWCAWPEDFDQRPDWTDMKERYGSKFEMTWIKTSEITEFDYLFEHAEKLGLKSVWIYGFLENSGRPVAHHNDQFENISHAAFNNGFLKMKQMKFIVEWKCNQTDPCRCDSASYDDWRVNKITPVSEYRVLKK